MMFKENSSKEDVEAAFQKRLPEKWASLQQIITKIREPLDPLCYIPLSMREGTAVPETEEAQDTAGQERGSQETSKDEREVQPRHAKELTAPGEAPDQSVQKSSLWHTPVPAEQPKGWLQFKRKKKAGRAEGSS